jgi:hypothetical protein
MFFSDITVEQADFLIFIFSMVICVHYLHTSVANTGIHMRHINDMIKLLSVSEMI